MPEIIFDEFSTVKYEGSDSSSELAYQFYDAERVVGKPLKEHMRFAAAYWHSFAMNGSDPFGGPTVARPWMAAGDPIMQAKVKADAVFEFFRVLDLPFSAFTMPTSFPVARHSRSRSAICIRSLIIWKER